MSLHAQQSSVTGIITSTDNLVITGALIQLDESNGSISDAVGYYEIKGINAGSYILKVTSIGFQPIEKKVNLHDGENLKINFRLKTSTVNLNEVTITAKSEATQLRESVSSVSVVEAKTLYTQNNNTSDVIKQISGVNVRQTGGFGKQVKFFLDGIPLSNFGSGLGINVLPVNLMEQIEVYKGVVPVDLGADALGGAVNIITRKECANYLDASYSIGSFNTHKINLNSQYVNQEKRFITGINTFYNHSDNNYKIDIEIPDQFGNPEPATVRRFHDQFTNYLINTYIGVYDKKYANRLTFSARYSGLNDDLQHNAVMAQPYGEVTYDESTLGFSANYEKEELFPNTSLKWYGGVNMTKGNLVDTTFNVYTWDGKVYGDPTDGGEISTSRNLLQVQSENAVSRFNLRHRPWNKGVFTINVFNSWFTRAGKDSIAAKFYGEDFYTNPASLIKNATALAYEHSFSNSLVSYTSVKHFFMNADGYSLENRIFQPNQQTVSNFGVSQSLRYRFSKALLVKASYEYATSLPDETELFGDFTLVHPNPFLNPEQSHNANLGLQYSHKKLKVELNTFYRLTDNIIWLRTSQFFAQYQNLLKALVKGLDAEVQYQPLDFVKLKANITYQDIRNRSPRKVTGSIDDRYYDARLPNIPYLFGNMEVRYQKENFAGTNNRFSAWWSTSYVHEFFLFWAVDGNKDFKNTIPGQFIQNVGVTYSLPADRLSVSLEATNLFNQKHLTISVCKGQETPFTSL